MVTAELLKAAWDVEVAQLGEVVLVGDPSSEFEGHFWSRASSTRSHRLASRRDARDLHRTMTQLLPGSPFGGGRKPMRK